MSAETATDGVTVEEVHDPMYDAYYAVEEGRISEAEERLSYSLALVRRMQQEGSDD